jgi:elongation factor Ts
LYISPGSKLGILSERNCEINFVARQEEFEELAKNIAIQIASNPEIFVVSVEDISKPVKEKVHRLESSKNDFEGQFEVMKVFSSVNIEKKFYSISKIGKVLETHALRKSDYKIISNGRFYDTQEVTTSNISEGFVVYEKISI